MRSPCKAFSCHCHTAKTDHRARALALSTGIEFSAHMKQRENETPLFRVLQGAKLLKMVDE
jgi:hypothetical protein